LSYAGYFRETSPSLDRFAASAVVFTQAIAKETETGPSLGSMFTSLYPNELGRVGNGRALPSSAETLADLGGDGIRAEGGAGCERHDLR